MTTRKGRPAGGTTAPQPTAGTGATVAAAGPVPAAKTAGSGRRRVTSSSGKGAGAAPGTGATTKKRTGRGGSANKKPRKKKPRSAPPPPTPPHTDRHAAHATKTESEELRRQLVQYMDSSGYVSWSAKNRRYTILGTSTSNGGLVPCPSCGVGQLLVIKSPKTGKRFMGCSNFYGGCDASSPLLQKARLRATKKPCKACGWPEVIFRYSSRQSWTRRCSNIACPTRNQARSDG